MAGTRYDQIAAELTARRGGLREPLRLPVEQALATRHRVARDTVRRALDLLERQGAVIRQRGLGTFLQPANVRLASLKGASVGFVPPHWADSTTAWFTSTVLDGVSRWAAGHGCSLSVLHVDHQPRDVEGWVREARDRNLAGLLWVHPQRMQMPLVEHTGRHFPCVVLGRHYADYRGHYVAPDYDRAAWLIDQHLHKLGHQHYSFVCVDSMEAYTQNWISALEAVHRKRGEVFDTHWRILDLKGWRRERVADMLLEFHQPNDKVQAYVLSMSTLLSHLVAHERFRDELESGRLSVVAMDYGVYPMDAYWPGRTVTHVSCDWSRVGARAMEVLSQLAAGHPAPRVIREPVAFVTGDTTQPWRD